MKERSAAPVRFEETASTSAAVSMTGGGWSRITSRVKMAVLAA